MTASVVSRTRLPAIATAIAGAIISLTGFFVMRALELDSAHYAARGMGLGADRSWVPPAVLVGGLMLTGWAAHAVLTAMQLKRALADQQRTEWALRESEARLKRAQRIAKLGSWEWIPETGCLRWAAGGLRIFGYDGGVTDRPPSEWSE